MRCPQCGAEVPELEWNCGSCRINVYWASQHYQELAQVRQSQGLSAEADTPVFLREVHQLAMTERADRGGRVEHKVRQIARRVMRQTESRGRGSAQASQAGGDTAQPA